MIKWWGKTAEAAGAGRCNSISAQAPCCCRVGAALTIRIGLYSIADLARARQGLIKVDKTFA
jgi:hypothetical protein